MDREKMKKLKQALKSNESFLEFIKQGTESDGYQKSKEHVERGPHPTREMLYDYVLNWTDQTDDENIMDHIAFCSVCSKEVLSIMKIEHELEEDMLHWINQQTLIEKLKQLVSSLSIPVYSFAADGLATRGEAVEKEKNQYTIDESIVFCVPITSDGHLVILHYDESEKVNLVFPSGSQDNTFVRGGSEKKISGRVTGPAGKQNFKVIWTSHQLIESEKINFNSEEDTERTINEFLDALAELNEGEWIETDYGFEVTEG
jgi:hypothetical protein